MYCTAKHGYIEDLSVCHVFSILHHHFWETCDVEKVATEGAKGELSGYPCLFRHSQKAILHQRGYLARRLE